MANAGGPKLPSERLLNLRAKRAAQQKLKLQEQRRLEDDDFALKPVRDSPQRY